MKELIEETPVESAALEVRVTQNPGLVLVDKKVREEFYEHVRREVESFVPDLTTDKGRKAIASLAFKVARTKTAIDDAGAALKSEWLKQSQAVDESRREIRAKFDELRDLARKPLDDWEASELARKERHQKTIQRLHEDALIPMGATIEYCEAKLESIRPLNTSIEFMQEFAMTADAAKRQAFTSLTSAIERLKKEDADRKELERLRAAEEVRIAAEREQARFAEKERLKAEAEERERLAEERRAKLEAERIEQARVEAETRARKEAEQKARDAQALIERAHAEEIAALKAQQEKKDAEARIERERLERQAAAERARVAKEEADRKKAEEFEERKRLAAADEARRLAANKKHRQTLMTAAKLALMEHAGIEEKVAIAVVTVIVNGKVPNVVMEFSK